MSKRDEEILGEYVEHLNRNWGSGWEVVSVTTRQVETKMSDYYNVSTPTEGKEGKTYWRRVGVAFKSEKGMSVILDALPVNGKLFISKQDDKYKQGGNADSGVHKQLQNEDIPF